MTIARGLRWTATAIAILAFVDPGISLAGRVRPRLALVVQDGPSMRLPTTDGRTRLAVASQVARDLMHDLESKYEIVRGGSDRAAATVVVGDHYPDNDLPDEARAFTVTVSDRLRPNVRIAEVNAPTRVPMGTTVRLAVLVDASAMAGSRSDLVVRSHGAEVGRASHDWTQDAESWRADLVAVPVGAPPFVFDIHVGSNTGERTDLDNAARIVVDLAKPFRVYVLEARPSWASAFVRRALERDPRFEINGLSQVSPNVRITSGDSSSVDTGRDVDRFDPFDVVVAGGLDQLSENQRRALEHFAGERGGAVVLLPDTRASAAPFSRLLPGTGMVEELLERPVRLPAATASPQLDASELLEAATIPRDANVLVKSPGSERPIVWVSRAGEGQVLFSGAMDAWRFRGAPDDGFDRFWRSTVAGLAMEARPPIDVRLMPNRAAPGDRVRVWARVRRLEQDRASDRLSITAHVDDEEPLRLWPQAERGSFAGSFVLGPNVGGSSVAVTVVGGEMIAGEARLAIDSNARETTALPLALLAEAHGGIDVVASELGQLQHRLPTDADVPVERRPHYPMRSPWWIVPFAACLSSEWWLRRRSGGR